jgi:hypothetical protein
MAHLRFGPVGHDCGGRSGFWGRVAHSDRTKVGWLQLLNFSSLVYAINSIPWAWNCP